MTSFQFVLEYRDMDDVMKIRKHLGCFINEQKIAFVPLYCDRNMNDVISTGKILENTWLRLVLSLGIFPVKITSFMFLTRRQAIFHLLTMKTINILGHSPFITPCLIPFRYVPNFLILLWLKTLANVCNICFNIHPILLKFDVE